MPTQDLPTVQTFFAAAEASAYDLATLHGPRQHVDVADPFAWRAGKANTTDRLDSKPRRPAKSLDGR